MKPVRLNRQITIEKKVTTTDAATGRPKVAWEPLSYEPGSPPVAERYWAELLDDMPSRTEALEAGLNIARNRTRLRMRWRDDIDSTMRVVVWGDSYTTYQIVGGPAEIGGRKRYIEMLLEKHSTQGG